MTPEIKKYSFKDGLPQEFEIVDIAELCKEIPETLATTHRIGFYNIIWFQEGSPTHIFDFKPVKIVPDTLLFLNKDTVQRFDNKTPFEAKAILFTDSFFCKTDADTKFLKNSILFNDLFSVSQVHVSGQVKVFADLLGLMAEELQNNKDNYQADVLQNLLHNFLLLGERARRKQNFVEIKKGADLEYVMLFKDYLEEHYRKQKQVSYYARQISITEKRLNQATTKVLAKTPKELIDDRVMLEAKRLLAHTSQNVKEIGFNLGFEEPTNFIKYFKKHAFSTPVEFREKINLD